LDVLFHEEWANIGSMRWARTVNSHCANEIGCLCVYCSEPVSDGKQWKGLLRTVSVFDNSTRITIDCFWTSTVISCWHFRTETGISRNEKTRNWKQNVTLSWQGSVVFRSIRDVASRSEHRILLDSLPQLAAYAAGKVSPFFREEDGRMISSVGSYRTSRPGSVQTHIDSYHTSASPRQFFRRRAMSRYQLNRLARKWLPPRNASSETWSICLCTSGVQIRGLEL